MLRWLYENKVLSRVKTNKRSADRLFPRGLKKTFKKILKRVQDDVKLASDKVCKASKKATKILRKFFEHKRIRQVLGVNLLSAAVLLSQITTPASAIQSYSQPGLLTLPKTEVKEIEVETKTGFQTPLENFRISQGYHLFHLAVDLAAPIGSPIKPVAQGKIERVEYGRWGYGNSILINHGSNLKSFYAHMGRAEAKKGEEVGIEDTIGTVGTSGRTTGPHLHLELWQNDRPLNPRVILDLQVNTE